MNRSVRPNQKHDRGDEGDGRDDRQIDQPLHEPHFDSLAEADAHEPRVDARRDHQIDRQQQKVDDDGYGYATEKCSIFSEVLLEVEREQKPGNMLNDRANNKRKEN